MVNALSRFSGVQPKPPSRALALSSPSKEATDTSNYKPTRSFAKMLAHPMDQRKYFLTNLSNEHQSRLFTHMNTTKHSVFKILLNIGGSRQFMITNFTVCSHELNIPCNLTNARQEYTMKHYDKPSKTTSA